MSFLAVPSLRWRLVVVMCLAYVVVALTTLVAGYTTLQTNLHNQLQSQAKSSAVILAAGAAASTHGTSGTLQLFLDSLKKAQGLVSASVFHDGIVLGSTKPDQIGKPAPPISLTQFQQSNAIALPVPGNSSDMEGVAPISGYTVLGFAEVVVSGSGVQQELNHNLIAELLVRGLGLVIFVLLSLVISQYILGPLSRLARAASAIRAGYLGARITVADGTELGTVAAAFNDMADSLERRIGHLSFLAEAGAALPNAFREQEDIEPILAEFCRRLDASGACLLTTADPGHANVCYQEPGNTGTWEAMVRVAGSARKPTARQEGNFFVVAVPVLGDAVFVAARAGDQPFAEDEQQVISNFAYEIGIAADNARLLESQQEALQVKDQFLSIVSHELRTPLTTIKGYAQMLRLKMKGDPQSERYAGHIDSQVSRLSRLVDDLLDVTRFSRGQFELMPEEMNLQPVLEDVVNRFRVIAPKHTLRLQTDEGPLEGTWDPDRLEQVMNNLVSNAVKYSPDGGDVVIGVRHENEHLIISVRDQGVGIPPEDQEQLFQRFYRGSAEGQDIKGLGLGLYVTRRIVEAHGGTIAVHSEPDRGSEFYFSLPLTRCPAESAAS